jgi:hypothetical protein
MPSLRAVLHACSAAALVLAAACADSTSPRVQPTPGEPAASLRLVCSASVAKRTVECAVPGAAEGVRADRILGQGAGMKLTSGNIAIVADSFTFDMTVTNQFEYPVGTTDGVNPDPNGIRVFFVDGIHTTSGTGSVTVANADGVDAFTATGQAYFAYHGVLEPAATTAPRRWKLRFDPGVETFSFGLYVSTPVPPGGGTVVLTILEPVADATFTDSVLVRVQINSSPASIHSVKAFVADRSVVLTPVAAGVVRGTLPLTGLPFGPHQIRVHAVTVRADTGNAYVTIRKDGPPALAVAQPTINVVARPNLRIDADCVDDNPAGCTSVVATIGGVQLASGTTGIHTDVSLAAYNGTHPTIQIDALDSGGHKRTAFVSVYVQTGTPLVFVDSAGRNAMDVDSARLLFSDAASTVWLRDRAAGTRTLVQASPVTGPEGRLFSLGAIFRRSADGRIYEWRNGALVDLDAVSPRVRMQGSWAAWVRGLGVARRDLTAGSTISVWDSVYTAGSVTGEVDVAANGDVVYVISGTHPGLRRYRAGVITQVTTGASNPVTDGSNVVYMKSSQVTMWDGAGETTLSNTLSGATRDTHYAVNGGWVAYLVVDGGGATQVRTRDPGGTIRQATLSGTGSLIRALSPDGTVVFANGGAQYVIRAPYGAAPTRLGPDWFRAAFRGTELRLFLGNTVFGATY